MIQAEVAQQGTPVLAFQRGFDFTTVDLWSPGAKSSGQQLHSCRWNLCKPGFLVSWQQLLVVQGLKITELLVHSMRNHSAPRRFATLGCEELCAASVCNMFGPNAPAYEYDCSYPPAFSTWYAMSPALCTPASPAVCSIRQNA